MCIRGKVRERKRRLKGKKRERGFGGKVKWEMSSEVD